MLQLFIIVTKQLRNIDAWFLYTSTTAGNLVSLAPMKNFLSGHSMKSLIPKEAFCEANRLIRNSHCLFSGFNQWLLVPEVKGSFLPSPSWECQCLGQGHGPPLSPCFKCYLSPRSLPSSLVLLFIFLTVKWLCQGAELHTFRGSSNPFSCKSHIFRCNNL